MVYLLGINDGVPTAETILTRTTKGFAPLGISRRLRWRATTPQAQSEGPTISEEPDDLHTDDASISTDIEIEEQ